MHHKTYQNCRKYFWPETVALANQQNQPEAAENTPMAPPQASRMECVSRPLYPKPHVNTSVFTKHTKIEWKIW